MKYTKKIYLDQSYNFFSRNLGLGNFQSIWENFKKIQIGTGAKFQHKIGPPTNTEIPQNVKKIMSRNFKLFHTLTPVMMDVQPIPRCQYFYPLLVCRHLTFQLKTNRSN